MRVSTINDIYVRNKLVQMYESFMLKTYFFKEMIKIISSINAICGRNQQNLFYWIISCTDCVNRKNPKYYVTLLVAWFLSILEDYPHEALFNQIGRSPETYWPVQLWSLLEHFLKHSMVPGDFETLWQIIYKM